MRDHQLSLRSRLLLCVGAITLLALLAADFAVYTSLNSYLYGQTDQSRHSVRGHIGQPLGIVKVGLSTGNILHVLGVA